MASVAQVELDRLERDIAEKQAVIDQIRSNWDPGLDFDTQMVNSAKVLEAQREIDRLSGRLATLRGDATLEMRGTLARELKETVLEAILTSDVMDKVRQLWSVQDPTSRLSFIRLGVDYGGSGIPTVSITGDATRVRKTQNARTYWVYNGKQLSTSKVIETFGGAYGQVKAFDDMNASERVELRDRIVAGEGLEATTR